MPVKPFGFNVTHFVTFAFAKLNEVSEPKMKLNNDFIQKGYTVPISGLEVYKRLGISQDSLVIEYTVG